MRSTMACPTNRQQAERHFSIQHAISGDGLSYHCPANRPRTASMCISETLSSQPATKVKVKDSELSEGSGSRRKSMSKKQFVDRQKLIVILVGLPGRGKTFPLQQAYVLPSTGSLCIPQFQGPCANAFSSGCMLNCARCRLGHDTRHFNVGQYRRKQKPNDEVQDASFFDTTNQVRSQQYLPGLA